ncbi:hypothetical protein BMMON2_21890 [Burkholderia mallei]
MFQLNLTILSAMAFASIAAIVTALILKWLLASGWAWRLATDVPNARSMHTRPTPRMGGWGIVPVGAVAIGIAAPHLWGIVAAMLFLAIVSHIDDRRGYPRGFDSLPTSSRPRRLPRCIRGLGMVLDPHRRRRARVADQPV